LIDKLGKLQLGSGYTALTDLQEGLALGNREEKSYLLRMPLVVDEGEDGDE
jgi:hypothetical protein